MKLHFELTKRAGKKLDAIIDRIIAAILAQTFKPIIAGGEITITFGTVSMQLGGSKAMAKYTVPNDQAPVNYAIAPIVVEDAEGEVKDASIRFYSSDPEVVAVNGDVLAGNLSFGRSGVASVILEATVKVGAVTIVARETILSFVVTTGAVGEVTGGEITLEGLTPDPEPPAEG